MQGHPTFAINLEKRIDRKRHILNQFKYRSEFNFELIKANEHNIGSIGLWETILSIVRKAKRDKREYIIICEDDHHFTNYYNSKNMGQYIVEADKLQADVLLGGVSWYKTAMQVSDNLFWIDKFSGLQFTVIFSRIFDAILDASFRSCDASDYKLSELSLNKFVIFPFISVQKEFGYSDITLKNNERGYVSDIFNKTATMLNQLSRVKSFYKGFPTMQLVMEQYNEIELPCYILTYPGNGLLSNEIKNQFRDKNEFDLHVIQIQEHKSEEFALWGGLLKAILNSSQNDDDLIVICRDNHKFTSSYSKNVLLRNIIEANEQGADILFADADSFGQIMPISAERYWINPIKSSLFFIVYKKMFKKILSHKFKSSHRLFEVLSILSSHKMLLYPFISTSVKCDLKLREKKENNRRMAAICAAFRKYEPKNA